MREHEEHPDTDRDLRRLDPLTKTWPRTWGLPGLEHAVDVSFSPRLKHSLGRCTPSTGRIVLNDSLRTASRAKLADALCHELAHVAAFILYGGAVTAHGREWAQLVADAGFTPRSSHSAPRAVATKSESPRKNSRIYEHRCPVCQTVRIAKRPVTRWRCAECVAAGLSGEMIITRRPHAAANR